MPMQMNWVGDWAVVLDYPEGVDVSVGDLDDAEFFVGEERVVSVADVLQGWFVPIDVNCVSVCISTGPLACVDVTYPLMVQKKIFFSFCLSPTVKVLVPL